MALLERGASSPERREGRHRLSVNDPRTTRCLAALEVDDVNMAELARFCNAMFRDIDAFHRRRASQPEQRISKARAHQLFAHTLAGFAGRRADG